ncbi:MAG: nucleotidyltransferase family protein [Acidobacteria bacterium]|nr:nucleotidyltransferase family protein [Acidobacteriota bacterium]
MRSVNSIVPIVLAAGDSARMGYPKALLPFGTEVFLTHTLTVLRNSGLPRPLIILGRSADAIKAKIRDWPADIRINPDPDRGQLSSIQLALTNISPEFDGGMIWPVDQPVISEDLVRRLTRLFLDSECLIACPKVGDRRGHPAIFHRSLFQEFLDAPLEEGPKKILLRHQHEIAVLPTEESGAIHDIDTPEDYQALIGESLESVLARMQSSR